MMLTDAYGQERDIDPAAVTGIRAYHGGRSVLWVDQGPGAPTLILVVPHTVGAVTALLQGGTA